MFILILFSSIKWGLFFYFNIFTAARQWRHQQRNKMCIRAIIMIFLCFIFFYSFALFKFHFVSIIFPFQFNNLVSQTKMVEYFFFNMFCTKFIMSVTGLHEWAFWENRLLPNYMAAQIIAVHLWMLHVVCNLNPSVFEQVWPDLLRNYFNAFIY